MLHTNNEAIASRITTIIKVIKYISYFDLYI